MGLPYRPRILHQIYAFVAGYFWLPCRICGRYHGGHEKNHGLWMPREDSGTGHGFCSVCAQKALQLFGRTWIVGDEIQVVWKEVWEVLGEER